MTGLFLLSAGVTSAQATKPAPVHKVTLCHRTASAAGGNQHNGYNIITVDIASVANAKSVRGHDSHEQQGNGPGGDIIPSFTYKTFTYPGKNLGDGGQAFLDNGCHAVVVPEGHEPEVVVTQSEVTDCVAKEVTITTVTTTTSWMLEGDVYVKGEPVSTQEITTRDTDAEDCPVVTEKPEPVVVVTHSDKTDCAADVVRTTTVTTTTDWMMDEGDNWVKKSPVSVENITTRAATAQECPVVVAPVTVAGVEAVAPAVAVVNPVPAAASAGAADTSGQLVAGGLMGMAAMLAFGAAFASRRRQGEV